MEDINNLIIKSQIWTFPIAINRLTGQNIYKNTEAPQTINYLEPVIYEHFTQQLQDTYSL